jgi:hypothetical protein
MARTPPAHYSWCHRRRTLRAARRRGQQRPSQRPTTLEVFADIAGVGGRKPRLPFCGVQGPRLRVPAGYGVPAASLASADPLSTAGTSAGRAATRSGDAAGRSRRPGRGAVEAARRRRERRRDPRPCGGEGRKETAAQPRWPPLAPGQAGGGMEAGGRGSSGSHG